MNSRRLQRRLNGVRKIFAGLRPFSESVWPGVRNDLFVAHESIYGFAAGFCEGRSVLDAGCGTGYGSRLLAERGAASVLAVDLDPANIRYARRHHRHDRVTYRRGDLENLGETGPVDVVVASNSLEHLDDPARFLSGVRCSEAVIAVPPIRNEYELAMHAGIEYHRAPLSVDEWIDLFRAAGFSVRFFLHQTPHEPDFSSPFPTHLRPSDFSFPETTYEGLRMTPTITAIFVLYTSAPDAIRP
jgi:SAM-dependent methyltransferase